MSIQNINVVVLVGTNGSCSSVRNSGAIFVGRMVLLWRLRKIVFVGILSYISGKCRGSCKVVALEVRFQTG